MAMRQFQKESNPPQLLSSTDSVRSAAMKSPGSASEILSPGVWLEQRALGLGEVRLGGVACCGGVRDGSTNNVGLIGAAIH